MQLLPHCGILLPLVSPPADPTLTTSNMLSVLSGVEERWEELGRKLDVGWSKMNEIRQHHRSNTDRMEALTTFISRYHHAPSWQEIASALQEIGLQDLADVVTTKCVRGRQLYRFIIGTSSEFASISSCVLATYIPSYDVTILHFDVSPRQSVT